MTNIAELDEILRKHASWLRGEPTGERANLDGAYLQGAKLGGADLRGATMDEANLQGANLQAAKLGGADLVGAFLRDANLQGADLQAANLEGAHLVGANLRGANLQCADLQAAALQGADLRAADMWDSDLRDTCLRGANLEGADLGDADLRGAELRGTTGLVDPIDYIAAQFEVVPEGVVCYMIFGDNYVPPAPWRYEPGAVLTEVVHPDRATDSGSGVTVATLGWVRENNGEQRPVWRCLIRWPWLAGVVVPFGADGKIRASRVELLRIVEEEKG